MPSTAVMCCCSRVSGAGVAGIAVDGGVEEDGPATAFGAAGGDFLIGSDGWTKDNDGG